MLSIYLQELAKQDLKDIWRYSYENWGTEQADRYFSEISEKLNLLTENPTLGMRCDYIRTGYRQYPINKPIVFYKISDDQIDVIRVLHEKMDFNPNSNLN